MIARAVPLGIPVLPISHHAENKVPRCTESGKTEETVCLLGG